MFYLFNWKAYQDKSIRNRLIVSFSSLIFIINLTYGAFLIYQSRKDLTGSLVSKSVSLARTLSLAASNSIGQNKIFDIRKLLNDIVNNDNELAYGMLIDTQDENVKPIVELKKSVIRREDDLSSIRETEKILEGKVSLGRLEKKLSISKVDIKSAGIRNNFIEIQYPIFNGEIQWGWLKLGFNTARLEAKIQNNAYIFIAGFISFLFLGILGSLLIGNEFMNPIQRLIQEAKKLSNHDFSVNINCRRNDELGFLARTFDDMKNNLKDLIIEIITATHSLTFSTKNAFKTLDTFSHNAESQAETIKGMTISIDQIHAEAEFVSKNSNIQFQRMDEVVNCIKDLTRTMESMDNSLMLVESIMASNSKKAKDGNEFLLLMNESMKSITKSSKKVSSIMAMIHDISDKINLLSLNAAIEAARAGSYGKGFAVVAKEINKLAEQTEQSIEEIDGVLAQKNEEITKGMKNIRLAGSYIQDILHDTETVANLMNDVFSSMETQKRVNQLANSKTMEARNEAQKTGISIKEQGIKVTRVKESMVKINKITHQNTSSAQVLSDNIYHLVTMADKLKSRVDYFKTN